MLTREQARDQLKTFHLEDWKERRLASVAALPESLREIGAAALDFSTGYGWTPEERGRAAARWQALLRLDALGVSERQQLFSALWPHIGAHVEATWQLRKRLPYQRGGHRRAFRAPNAPEVTLWTRAAWFDQLLRMTAGYEQDIGWFATWAPYLGYGVDELLGVLLAATIDAGGDEGQAVFDVLTTSARGEHPIGAMGRHVSRALLTASHPEGWDFMEGMLLAAQRQEGLRQVILESIDEAHPLAFRRMLRLILERNLVRFSATVRAADVWFGLMWDVASPRVITSTLERALRYLDDGDSRVKALNGNEAEDAYLALWAAAFEDAPATIEPASRLLAETNVERRFVGAHLLAMLGLPDAQPALIPALDDDDVRIAARAFMELRHANPESVEADLFERLERNLLRFPRHKQALKPLVWPWMRLAVTQADVAGALIHHLRQLSPKRLIPHLSVMDPGDRARVARQLAQLKKWDAEVRDVFFKLVGDASPSVREVTLHAIQSQSLGADEVIRLEKLLAREAGDLRRGVINLLLKLEDRAALASAQRLLASSLPQRLAGLELLLELQKADRAPAECKAMALAYRDEQNTIAPGEAKLLDSLTAEMGQSEAPTLENALGLHDPAQRTKPTPPVLRQKRGIGSLFVNESLVTPAAWAMRQSLDELVHAHRETPITIETWQGAQEELLGNMHWTFPGPQANVPLEKDLERLPLRDVWEAWWLKRPAAERDRDSLEILRAVAPGEFRVHPHFTHETPAWLQTVFAKLYGKPQEIDYSPQVQTILLWLMRLHPPEGATDFLLDAVETTLALIPPQELARKSEPDRSRSYWHYSDWRDNGKLLGWLHLARTHRALCPQEWTNAHHVRLWGLLRWMDEPGTDLPRHRPPLEEALIAHRAGGATEADLLDHLLGPRPREGYFSPHSFRDLDQLTSRKPHPALAEFPVLRELVDRCRERIIAVELRRGDLPTTASAPALSLRSAGGLKTLIQLLQAFSRGKFVRGWIQDSKSKDAVFSHLIRSTFPEDGDTPDSFAAQVKVAALPAQRLIELAMYAPQWARHVEQALGWPGLADGVWWIHAHTKDRYWRVDRDLREAWVAQTSERTPLAGENLLDGAVDVAWFQRVRQTLNGKRWESLYEAALYASGGQGHGRARLFADAMMGRITKADLVTRMMTKRHQDSARALGLLPLAKGKRGEADVLERYKAIQEFKRGSRKFGSMRQVSEKLAARIGLENLARTAGYPDPVLLLAVGPRLLPEYRDPEAGRPDLISAALSLAAVLAVIFGLKQIAQDGLAWRPALSILAGLALGIAFVRRQLVLADPLINLRLFRVPAFSASLATYALGVFVLFGGFLFLPQYLQLVLGLSPLESGLWTLPWAIAFVVGSNLTPVIVRRVRPAFVMAAGLALAAVGFGMFTQVDAASGFTVFVTGSVAFALGFSPVFTLTNDLLVGSAPPERAGAAAAVAETAAEFGGALGIAVFGSLGIAVYRSMMAGEVPAGVPVEAAQAVMDTLGGAVVIAGQLPDQLGAALVAAARGAFIQGLQVSAAISAVGALGIAILVVVLLRQVGGSVPSEAHSDLATAAQTATDG